jgi:thiol-disulfide isomerase/thioredoxin
MAKSKKCAECDKPVGTMKPTLCDDCAYKNWDEGFSSQADYSDKMFEQQQKEKKWREIFRTNTATKTLLTQYIHEWRGWQPFWCGTCKTLKLSFAEVKELYDHKDPALLIAALLTPCKKCGTTDKIMI